jgi:hypothetical protein
MRRAGGCEDKFTSHVPGGRTLELDCCTDLMAVQVCVNRALRSDDCCRVCQSRFARGAFGHDLESRPRSCAVRDGH